MRVLIQRVTQASVVSDGVLTGEIKEGLLIFAGFEDEDDDGDLEYATRKIVNLRIFDDESGVMNLSVLDISGEILLISQFTLHAITKKGNRPSYIKAARPEKAIPLYEKFKALLTDATSKEIKCGVFGADMKVSLLNNGPVTIWIDTKEVNY
ncbi:MAG: D-tyrosyl-tRNA(Tyr) deacylase [Bacteroidetes bacterium HGW-Bacteroidetes-8]|jgi:D-tyrosyl-tRNA(Tyr) deacylase|nr:MAG: D-tyrosyl-tRNA(Tyr) deacylase [Bacteroidetes bacterium HGW-Bacteroidetes-8]